MKYMGSKARLSKDIAPIINNLIVENSINTYIEPFVGGANMMEHIICKNKIGYDNNHYLIEFWKAIQSGWTPNDMITKEQYYTVKDNKDFFSPEIVALVGFCASYNAKWFSGYAGEVKTKNGNIRNYYKEAVRNIMKQKNKLLNVSFETKDYRDVQANNCLIYCDPPYANTTKYGYDKGFNNEEFWDWVRKISKHNIVLISEYNAPDDFECIFEKDIITTLDKNSRSRSTEKLYTYKHKQTF